MGHIDIFRQNTHIQKAFLKANQHEEKETLLQQLRQYIVNTNKLMRLKRKCTKCQTYKCTGEQVKAVFAFHNARKSGYLSPTFPLTQ